MKDQLEDISIEYLGQKRRRKLLPVWMKIFIWIFMIMGGIAIPLVIFGMTGAPMQMALYGFAANKVSSFIGIIISILFLFKGFVAYSLWFEKDWAITAGLIDAGIGLLLCIISMTNLSFFQQEMQSGFRVEVIILIPYLIKLAMLKKIW